MRYGNGHLSFAYLENYCIIIPHDIMNFNSSRMSVLLQTLERGPSTLYVHHHAQFQAQL